MSDETAPDRIWAMVAGIQPPDGAHGIWDERDKRAHQPGWVEYIRADLGSFYQEKDVDAMQDRIAQIEAEKAAMREALGRIARASIDEITHDLREVAREALDE